MIQTELFADRLKWTGQVMSMALSDLTDAEMLVRPVPAANHTAWQVGHLITSEARMVAMTAGTEPNLPAGFAERFTKETSKSDDPDAFPKKQELLDVMSRVRERTVEWATNLKPDQLDQPTPEKIRQFAPTVAQLAALLPEHVMMHVGQIQVIRRKLGRPVMF
jgi:hypothetical protein